MYGAILGDIIGSPYEFNRGNKTKDFPLFSKHSTFTDDTVMTLAVADALHDSSSFLSVRELNEDNIQWIRNRLIRSMQRFGRKYPYAGYGGMFRHWLRAKDPQPYRSYGNGSAMRVSSAGWLFNDLETVRFMARLSAEVTHNHPEGIKVRKLSLPPSSWPVLAAPRQRSRPISRRTSITISAAAAMRSGPLIIM